MRLNRAALPADLRFPHRDVARPRDILAYAGTQPLRETDYSRGGAGVFGVTSLAFTHEGAFVLLLSVLATLALRGLRSTQFRRGAANMLVIALLAVASKMFLPPDEYYADTFVRAALHFFDPAIFSVAVIVELLAAIVVYAAMSGLLSVYLPKRACILALAMLLVFLCVFWFRFDHSVNASRRYYLRTALVIAIPLLGIMAAFAALTGEESHQSASQGSACLCLVQARNVRTCLDPVRSDLDPRVETGKFVAGWSRYRSAIAILAMSQDSRSGPRRSALCLVKTGPARSGPLRMVLDYSVFVL